jgi:hypothetical protein
MLSRGFIGSNEPHQVIPQHGCMSAVPLAFHPVWLFRSGERSIPFYSKLNIRTRLPYEPRATGTVGPPAG